MAETETEVYTTGESPLELPPSKTVRWEINSFDNPEDAKASGMTLEVDELGIPERFRCKFFDRYAKHRITLFRSPSLFGRREDKYKIGIYLNTNTDIKVRLKVKLSSGEPRVEHCLEPTVETVRADSSASVEFTLSQLGAVGQLIKRTNRVSIDIVVAVVAERVDSKRIISTPGPTLAKSLAACLEADDLKELADVDIVDKDDGIHPTHSFILKVRSQHFRSMFRHDMQESRTGRVLVDASSNAVEQLLKFMYTDEIDTISQDESLLMEVLGLGGLYSLPRLKALVEMQMKSTLSIENVAGRLLVLVRHNSPLRKDCVDFIKGNIGEVVKTEDWAEISKDASVMVELMHHGSKSAEATTSDGDAAAAWASMSASADTVTPKTGRHPSRKKRKITP